MIKRKKNKYFLFMTIIAMLLINSVVIGDKIEVKAQGTNDIVVSNVIDTTNVTINVTSSVVTSDWITITLYNRANNKLVFIDQIRLSEGECSFKTVLDPGTYYGNVKSGSDSSIIVINDFTVKQTTNTDNGGTIPDNNGSSGNIEDNSSTNSVVVQVILDNSNSTPKAVINFDSSAISKHKVNEVKPTLSDSTRSLELKMKVDNIKGGTGSLALSANKLTMSIPFLIMDLNNVETGAYAKLEQTTSSTDESLKGLKGIGEVLSFYLALYNNEGTKLSEVHKFAQDKVKINIEFTDAQIKNLNLSKLAACYYNEENKNWEYVGGSYDSAKKIFSFETEHFSKFTVADMSSVPVFDTVVNQNADQGNFLQFKVNASSSNNMNLTYMAENLPTGANFDAVSQNLNWTPNVDQAGSYTISFSVTDGVSTVKKAVTVIVRDVPVTELVNKALVEKDFYHFNIAYYKVVKLSDEKKRAENLDKLATIHGIVWNEDVANINKTLEDLVTTGSGKIYDDIQVVINNANLSSIDKGYLLGEVTTWGKKLVFTDEYINAVDAVVNAWTKLDADSVSKAEAAINKVTNAYSKEYLLGEIDKIKAKMK